MHEAVGTETQIGTPEVPGALAGGHAQLHSSRGVTAHGIHSALRLVERGGYPVRDAGRPPAFFCQHPARDSV